MKKKMLLSVESLNLLNYEIEVKCFCLVLFRLLSLYALFLSVFIRPSFTYVHEINVSVYFLGSFCFFSLGTVALHVWKWA